MESITINDIRLGVLVIYPKESVVLNFLGADFLASKSVYRCENYTLLGPDHSMCLWFLIVRCYLLRELSLQISLIILSELINIYFPEFSDDLKRE